jgi:hypothetical protein
MKAILALVALISGIAAAAAQAPEVVRAEVIQFGVYEAKVTQTQTSGGTATGTVNYVDYKFVSDATTLPARRGVGFGFEYRLVGEPRGARVPIRSVTIFPAGGLRNAHNGQTFERSEFVESKTIGEPILKGYTLDEDWEVVPGTWVLQVWYGDLMLVEQSFTLTMR